MLHTIDAFLAAIYTSRLFIRYPPPVPHTHSHTFILHLLFL